jgi:BirA family biotin operon repressor/biotin-[acetyl-CoA-carboxylase] ligase
MDAPSTPWGAEQLWLDLRQRLPGVSIEVVAQTASTNTALLERARAGRRAVDLHPGLLVAEHQTGGRGRLGRRWHSQPGASLTFSLALPLQRADWSGLSLVVGIALAEALQGGPALPSPGPRIGLKWPNDLWLVEADGSGRKLGGILVETVAAGAQRMAVVGVGLNVAPDGSRPASEAGGLAGVSTGMATLAELEPGVTAPAVLHRVALPLVDALLAFDAEGFEPFVARWNARDLLRGRALRTTEVALPEGVGEGVAPDGALRVRRADGSLAEVRSGEVSVRPLGAVEAR